jgi:hypothetical protein
MDIIFHPDKRTDFTNVIRVKLPKSKLNEPTKCKSNNGNIHISNPKKTKIAKICIDIEERQNDELKFNVQVGKYGDSQSDAMDILYGNFKLNHEMINPIIKSLKTECQKVNKNSNLPSLPQINEGDVLPSPFLTENNWPNEDKKMNRKFSQFKMNWDDVEEKNKNKSPLMIYSNKFNNESGTREFKTKSK